MKPELALPPRPPMANMFWISPLSRNGCSSVSSSRMRAEVYSRLTPCGAEMLISATARSSRGVSSCGTDERRANAVPQTRTAMSTTTTGKSSAMCKSRR